MSSTDEREVAHSTSSSPTRQACYRFDDSEDENSIPDAMVGFQWKHLSSFKIVRSIVDV